MYETQKKGTQKAAPAQAASQQKQTGPVSDPYSGASLRLSGELAARVKERFGIKPDDLKLWESPQVAEMGAKATA